VKSVNAEIKQLIFPLLKIQQLAHNPFA